MKQRKIEKVCKDHGELTKDQCRPSGFNQDGTRRYRCRRCHTEMIKSSGVKTVVNHTKNEELFEERWASAISIMNSKHFEKRDSV